MDSRLRGNDIIIMKQFGFRILAKDKKTKARVGEITTPHGVIKTPAFVPVGTQATVKSMTPKDLHEVGAQLYFVNTYHMYLRPGIKVIEKLGGLHNFMGWDGPLITDSGGFQVFSLARENKYGDSFSSNDLIEKESNASRNNLVKITDESVEFQSHWDGSRHIFTPESSMDWQWRLGADIHIAFDDCTSYPVTHAAAKKSMERTHRWARRSLEEHKRLHALNLGSPSRSSLDFARDKLRPPGRWPKDSFQVKKEQALYGSIQGSVYEDLRKKSARFISSMDFDGIAIGGVSVGESKSEMQHVLDWSVPFLPDEKPRHLLGVGEIDDIFVLIENGIDTFDCVLPTRMARMGRIFHGAYTKKGAKWSYDITKKAYAFDTSPLEETCLCYTCRNFSRAYVHHLFRVRELLAYHLATIHNLFFIHTLVSSIAQSINQNRFLELTKKWL